MKLNYLIFGGAEHGSRPGVMPAMDISQAVGVDVRINLGGADIGVAQEFLHHP